MSFEEWCKTNNRINILNLWDCKLNNCNPSDITYGTKKKYYFKCPRDIHKSELKSINNITSNHIKNTICNQCNSFAQWGIDNLGKDFLDKYWDYEKNNELGVNPWEIDKGSNKFIYIKCQEKEYHDSYSIRIYDFYSGVRCSYCDKKKIHPNDSFAQYHINNTDINFLNKYWDYDKNTVDPWKLSSNNNTKTIYIKCQKLDYHGSYKTICNSFTNGNKCPYCNKNSGKVHPLDSLGKLLEDKDLLNLWSDKNKNSPYEYATNSGQEVYWKCELGEHKDYKREIRSSNRCEFRCPECVSIRRESFIQEKVRLFLENLNYKILHEYNCSIICQNPKINNKLGRMPYDNEIVELKLIVEVHGMQHYRITSYTNQQAKRNNTTPEYELHYQKLKDRYKRIFAKSQGYFYLEIPYWTEKDESYKLLINNKINEIQNITCIPYF